MAKSQDKKIFIPIYILFASILVVSLFITQKQDTRTRAATLDEEFRNCITPPKCCYDIVATGDAHACPNAWGVDGDGRGWCPPNMCAAIQGRGERCGWYWIFHDPETKSPTGYGCMVGDSEATMKMKFKPDGTLIDYPSSVLPTGPPTEVPRPTQIVLPTTPPTVPTEFIPPPTEAPPVFIQPTSPPLPTEIIRVKREVTYVPIRYPTLPPTLTLVPTKPPFQLFIPNILPPKEKVDSLIVTIKTNLSDFLSKILP